MADDLEARLQSHAKAFEGLMSLLPPDLYYGKQTTGDEWNKKKQTKAEKKAARKAKLDPANHRTAKDVADERDRKRRLEDEEAERAEAGVDGPLEQPMEGLKQPKSKAQKVVKGQDVHSNEKVDTSVTKESNKSKEERKREKELRRREKTEKKAAKKAGKQAQNQDKQQSSTKKDGKERQTEDNEEENEIADDEDATAEPFHFEEEMDQVDVSGLVQDEHLSASRSASPDPVFSPDAHSSISSVQHLVGNEESSKVVAASKASKTALLEDHETPEQARARKNAQLARLHDLINKHKAARNADGLDGKPARNRTELIEARRLKEQKRKEKKKELRAKDKEAAQRAESEAQLSSLRGSPTLGSSLFAPRSRSGSLSGSRSPSMANANTFSFGRMAFSDGARVNSSLSGIVDHKKAKGTSDAKTALLAAQAHQAKLNSLDEGKRAELEDKDVWLSARKRVNGEQVKDDVNLLKKTLKRRETAKKRSEKQWGERLDGVKKGQEMRQKKRENNIAKRKEEKGKGKGKKKGVTKKAGPRRAGFEGTFRGRS